MIITHCFLLFLFQEALLNSTWGMVENKTKTDLESQLNCCGLLNGTSSRAQFELEVKNCPAVSVEGHILNHCIRQERKAAENNLLNPDGFLKSSQNIYRNFNFSASIRSVGSE